MCATAVRRARSLSGRVCKALEEGRADDADGELDRLPSIFTRDNVYVEMQNAHLDVQQRINPLLVQVAERRNLPLVATGDVHYLRHEDGAHTRRCSASSPATRNNRGTRRASRRRALHLRTASSASC